MAIFHVELLTGGRNVLPWGKNRDGNSSQNYSAEDELMH